MQEDKNMETEGITLSTIQQMSERMPGGFLVYRANRKESILYVNDIVCDIFGCDTVEEFRELTGYTFRGMVYRDDYPGVVESILSQVEASEKNLDFVEYRIQRKDGTLRWVDDYGRLVHTEDQGDVYYVMMRDITEQRMEREEKLRMEMELEKERHVSELKAAFLFNISHDIRTPMNAIMGFTALAKRHLEDKERLRDYLDKVDESNRHLLELIDDLLEMSRLDYGRVEIKSEPCRLQSQLESILGMFHAQMEEKQISLKTEINLPEEDVLVDALRFRRVMENLISNAMKFTLPHGTVKISTQQKQVSDSGYARYSFKVSDNGIGMTEEFMRHMYEAFEREETSTKTGYIGTGLGLTITKKLLDIMGGSISVESQKGKGSTFTVELPLKLAGHVKQARRVPKEEVAVKANGKHRILLVEDIDVNRMLAETILSESGFEVESVPDGCDAVEAIQEHPLWYYDLVLMDIQMPVMNGYEATRSIRALGREDTDKIPIIALSANAREEDKKMSLESGMNSHVAKPFDIAHLISTINEYIEARKKELGNP